MVWLDTVSKEVLKWVSVLLFLPSLIASTLSLESSCLVAWLSDMSLAQLALDYVDRHMAPLGSWVCEARWESLRLAAKEEIMSSSHREICV